MMHIRCTEIVRKYTVQYNIYSTTVSALVHKGLTFTKGTRAREPTGIFEFHVCFSNPM